MSHPVSSKPISSYRPAHKNLVFPKQKPIPIRSRRYNPASPLKGTPQQASRNSACEYKSSQNSSICPDLLERPSLIINTHPRLPQLPLASILYSAFTDDAPSSNFSPSPAASVARHFLSSSDAVSYAALFALDWDSPIPKANYWPL